MKIQTLLFGAGQGAGVFIDNTASEREFVGFLDNDQRKFGKQFYGIRVYAPADVKSLQFDEIVITTQWAIDVKNQLLNELDIPDKKIILPHKNLLKKPTPFVQKETLGLARLIVLELSSLAQKLDVPMVVDFGTLLGLVRDDDIIPWDDDVDFSVPLSFKNEAEELLLNFLSLELGGVNWRVERIIDKNENVSGLLLKFSCPSQYLNEFTTSICFREVRNGQALHLPSLGMWYAPEKHFKDIDKIFWREQIIQVPLDYEDYLTFQYGDWKTPKKDMQLTDYANLNTVSFQEVELASLQSVIIQKG
ncbi:hypothetical protein GCM10009092_33970 [Bowmanella denitrificans]|uniref:LicD/FKTN/FKRP nucleotidyltransferase domain-containing protein n=1 Tax=Bowmanella denitrificans TaxID=366582 RepID=A0ABP3HBA9_9ALTE